jgi:hypothetical protein
MCAIGYELQFQAMTYLVKYRKRMSPNCLDCRDSRPILCPKWCPGIVDLKSLYCTLASGCCSQIDKRCPGTLRMIASFAVRMDDEVRYKLLVSISLGALENGRVSVP